MGITSILLCLETLAAHQTGLDFSEPPLWNHPQYRLLQAAAMPLIVGAGWLLCGLPAKGLLFLFRQPAGWRKILAVSAPALCIPIWTVFWPAEMAVALRMLDPDAAGYTGVWIRHAIPALTWLYMLTMLGMAYWQAFALLLREAFAVAVFSLLAVWGLWGLLLR